MNEDDERDDSQAYNALGNAGLGLACGIPALIGFLLVVGFLLWVIWK